MGEIAQTFVGLATSVSQWKRGVGVRLLHNSDIQPNCISIKKDEYLDEKFVERSENKRLLCGDVITVHTGDVGTSAVIEENYAGTIGFTTLTARVKDKTAVSAYYLSHFLNSDLCKQQIAAMIISDRSNLNQKSYITIKIPLPPLPEQQRIVDILDRFDALTNDISIGLPAEIEARRKQYEHYRDKLLSFKELKAS